MDLRNIRRSDISAMSDRHKLKLDLRLPVEDLRAQLLDMAVSGKLKKNPKAMLSRMVKSRTI